MSATYYRERVKVRPSEEVIDRKELDALRIMARRGSDYESAARQMRNAHVVMLERHLADPADKYAAGWLAAIREFSALVIGGPNDD